MRQCMRIKKSEPEDYDYKPGPWLDPNVLQNVGLVFESDTPLVIDKNKITGETYQIMQELKIENSEIDNDHLTGLYFDGWRDKRLSTK